MRHAQATLHVTRETKLSLPIEVELEPADSLVVDGVRVYVVGFVSNKTLMTRNSGCLLEKLRYRFYAGKEAATCELLSPWVCRNEFLHESAGLRECNAGLTAKRQGRGNTASLIAVRPESTPTHSWALGIHGVEGSYVLARNITSKNGDDWPLSPQQRLIDVECSGWRALLRDALQMDYSDWKQLEREYPAEWVRELLTPLPLTIEAREGAPTGRVVCQSLLDVLIVTTQLDGIRGLRLRVCRADGCGELFPVGNYEGKIYCNYECAHLQAVRNARKRKRDAIEKASRKPKKPAAKTKGRKAE